MLVNIIYAHSLSKIPLIRYIYKPFSLIKTLLQINTEKY